MDADSSDNDSQPESTHHHLDISSIDADQIRSEQLYQSTAAQNSSTFLKRLRESLTNTHDNNSTPPSQLGPDSASVIANTESYVDDMLKTFRQPSDAEQDTHFQKKHGVAWEDFCAVLSTTSGHLSSAAKAYVALDAGSKPTAVHDMPGADAMHSMMADLRTMRQVHSAQPQTTCKICQDQPVNVALQPCGHVMCSACSYQIGSTCPFCCGHIYTTQTLFFA